MESSMQIPGSYLQLPNCCFSLFNKFQILFSDGHLILLALHLVPLLMAAKRQAHELIPLLQGVHETPTTFLLAAEPIQGHYQGSNSSGIDTKSLRATFFISKGKELIIPRKQSLSFPGQNWDEAGLWGMGLLAVFQLGVHSAILLGLARQGKQTETEVTEAQWGTLPILF